MPFPSSCDICNKENINAHMFQGSIALDLKPIKGSHPSMLIAGQDPTITKGKVSSVLDLDNPKGTLYKYIVDQILHPADLGIENIYATDLIKCHFPDNQTPKVISDKNDISIKEFLFPFFSNCRRWFLKEVEEIKPTVILSLGEPVHQLLIDEFNWKMPVKIKEAFSNAYKVNLNGYTTFYIPCIHINSKGHLHYKNLWDKFIQNFKKTVSSIKLS
jgi:uracil-DNA glycosylase